MPAFGLVLFERRPCYHTQTVLLAGQQIVLRPAAFYGRKSAIKERFPRNHLPFRRSVLHGKQNVCQKCQISRYFSDDYRFATNGASSKRDPIYFRGKEPHTWIVSFTECKCRSSFRKRLKCSGLVEVFLFVQNDDTVYESDVLSRLTGD